MGSPAELRIMEVTVMLNNATIVSANFWGTPVINPGAL
jgi:hypothetical protein